MLTRKLGSILRGKATPFQIVAACVLGALLGFAPSLLKAPALVVLLVAALLVVNANLGLALLVAAGAKLLSFVALPLTFQLGRFLLDGPTSGLARAVVNAPILAWCGFDYYAVAGGQLLGLIVGLALGVLVTTTVSRFRRRMAAAQNDPGKLAQLAAKPGVRFLMWLLFGGTGKRTWEEKLDRRVGNPVRVWGAALLVLGLVGAWLGQRALAGPVARSALKGGLERANGATVDVGGAELDLGEGRVAVAGLALADPNALDTDLFRAERIEADVDEADLLRKRVHVSRVVVSDAWSGAARETPGALTEPRPDPEPEPEASAEEGDYTLEDVLADYETWKGRLGQAREWLDRMAGPPSADVEGEETFAERLEREARELGFAGVRAGHLVEDAPSLLLSELLVESFQTTFLPERTFDLRASALSSQPGLVDAPPTVEVTSRDGAIRFAADLAPVSRGGGDGGLAFAWTGLAVDDVMAQLKLGGTPPLAGGTLDLALDGAWDGGRIGHVDLPLRATVRNTTLTVGGTQAPVDELVLPIQLQGPIDAPKIHFDGAALKDALVAAGKQELANQVDQLVGEELGDELDELGKKTGVELPKDLDGAKGAIEGLFGKKKE